jgi:hypothetical protein
MTKISYIHGIGATAEERKQRAAEVPGPSLIDYTKWTEGELQLVLLAEQINMLAAYAPEDKELQKSKQILQDVLYRGVHRAGGLPGGIFTGRLATVLAAIRNARQLARPAAGEITGRKNGISGGIGDPIIPYEDCQVVVDDPNDPLGAWTYTDAACVKRNEIKKILNDNLENSAHHILYDFVANPNLTPPIVAVKTQNHRAARATLSQISKLSSTSLKMWIRNGVIRNNIAQGAGAIQPEDTIATLKSGAIAGIGEPLTAAALVAIIKAIAAAISAASALVLLLKQKDPQTAALWNQLQGIGTGVFGPEQNDWYTGAGGGNETQPGTAGDIEKLLPYGLILAGAYVLIEN